MIQGVSIAAMLSQSITVLTKPGIASFEQYEKSGGTREALVYVGVASAITAVVAFVFGIFGGIGNALVSLVFGFVAPIVAFYVFSYVLFYVGRSQGGTGTQDEVFYTNSLYVAPIQAITGIVGGIPFLGCVLLPVTLALLVYQAYLGYLGTRSSMNLDQNKAIITIVVAIIATWVASAIIGSIRVALAIGAGAASNIR